jgi:hypothetical protein
MRTIRLQVYVVVMQRLEHVLKDLQQFGGRRRCRDTLLMASVDGVPVDTVPVEKCVVLLKRSPENFEVETRIVVARCVDADHGRVELSHTLKRIARDVATDTKTQPIAVEYKAIERLLELHSVAAFEFDAGNFGMVVEGIAVRTDFQEPSVPVRLPETKQRQAV